jgi:hypothetical protein
MVRQITNISRGSDRQRVLKGINIGVSDEVLLVWVISISLGQLASCYALCAIGPGCVHYSEEWYYCLISFHLCYYSLAVL